MTPEDAFLAELAELRDLFTSDLGAMMGQLQAAFDPWAAGPPCPAPEPLVRQAHSLAGTAGAFGLSAISQAARQLETALDEGKTGVATADLTRLWQAVGPYVAARPAA